MSNGTRIPGSTPINLPVRSIQLAGDRNRPAPLPVEAVRASNANAPRLPAISLGVNGDNNNTPRPQSGERNINTNTNTRNGNRTTTPPPHLYLEPETNPDPESDTDIDTLPTWFDTMSVRVQNEVLRSMRAQNRNHNNGRVNRLAHRDTDTTVLVSNGDRGRDRDEETNILPRTVFPRSHPILIPTPTTISGSRRPSIRTPEHHGPDHGPPGFQGYRPRHLGPGRETTSRMFLGRQRERGRGQGQGGVMGVVGHANGVDHLSRGTELVPPLGAREERDEEQTRQRRRVGGREEVRARGAAGRRTGGRNGDANQDENRDRDGGSSDDVSDEELSVWGLGWP